MPCVCLAELDVVYRGRAAHAAAMPERGVNALDALVIAYQGIAALRQHIRTTERIHGIITDGGQAPNVVPERAAGRFYVRAATRAGARAAQAPRRGLLPAPAPRPPAPSSSCAGATPTTSTSASTSRWPSAFRANAESLGRVFFPMRQAAAEAPGQHRHGQRQPARAVDPPDAGGGAPALHDPQRRVRDLGRLGDGRRRRARRRQGARDDGARLPRRRRAARARARSASRRVLESSCCGSTRAPSSPTARASMARSRSARASRSGTTWCCAPSASRSGSAA